MMPFSILKNNYLFSLIDAIILCIDYFPKSNGMDHIGNNLYIIIKIINIITFKNKNVCSFNILICFDYVFYSKAMLSEFLHCSKSNLVLCLTRKH